MAPILTVHVKEITMATPDIVCVAVRDQEVVKYAPVQGAVEAGLYRSDVSRTNPVTGLTETAKVVGRDKSYLKFYDVKPTAFADRVALDNVANYPTIGGRTVTDVYRLTIPYEQAIMAVGGAQANQSVMEHLVFLKLDGDLPPGAYTISITGNTFPATPFTFDDKVTRCRIIGATQLGHRPADGDKVAYLQLWLPYGPNEGAVDLATDYGVSTFHVIDTKQRPVFTGTMTECGTPTQAETVYTNTYFPSMNVAPKTATAVNTATETITVPSHGYSTGQYKFFRGFSGVTGIEGVALQITVTDANNFTVSPGISGTWTAGTYITAHDGKVYDAVLRNRYGTYVYRLDYSAFVPTDPAERYKVYVPGFGVSDEFVIHDALAYKYAHNSLKGVYNQCIGIPLSAAVGGWERPVWGRDGVSGCQVFESMLPGNMHNENGFAAPRPADQYTNWITATRVTDFYGGMADAGDHDWQVQRHFFSLYLMLDFAYERLPSGSRNISFGFPKASATFDYTAIYDGIDAMPDVIHLALHFIEPLRRFQKVDGRVYSGMQFANPYSPSSDGAASNRWDPSWLAPFNPHLLAADHLSNYCYAAVAAKLGKLFQAAGHTTLGQTWIDSARLAYDWAETIYQDYAATGIASTAWNDYYVTVLDIKTRSGLTDPQLTTNFDTVQTFCATTRIWTICCLYAAYAAQTPDTDSAPFFAVIDALGSGMAQNGFVGYGTWEYSQCPTGNSTNKDYFNGRWGNDAEGPIYGQAFAGNRIYDYSGAGVNPTPRSPNFECIPAFLKSDTRSPAPYAKDNTNKFLKLLQAGETYNTGANPYVRSAITGIGVRQPHTLFLDREAMGIAASDIPGFACYMGTGSWGTAYIGNGLTVENPVNFTCSLLLTGDPYASSGGAKKLVEPYHHMIPHGLTHYMNTLGVFTTETDLAGPLFGRLAHSIFLHAWDGNTVTAQPKTRFFGRCV